MVGAASGLAVTTSISSKKFYYLNDTIRINVLSQIVLYCLGKTYVVCTRKTV
jgi:hypothetical protein